MARSKKESLIRKLKKNPKVKNPFALANFIENKKKKSKKKKTKKRKKSKR